MYDENKQREKVIKWCKNENSRIENSEMTQLKIYAIRCKINLQQIVTDRIRRWTCNVKEMKKVEK